MAEGPRSKKDSKIEKKGRGKKKRNKRKLAVWMFFTAAIAVVCGIIGYMLIILNGERILADNQDKLILPEASTIYDAQGKEVTKLGANREVVDFAEIPELMRDAVIATEDQRFEKHFGIDLYSIGRALVKDVVARSAVEGGSTITQQLAKNLFLTQDKTFFRKATEASIAVAIEHKMTKDEIITMYLNRIYFGKGAYGVKAAAEYYFNTDLKDLKLWQIATLAGIPKAPSTYNPINHADKSKDRRAIVLQLMYDQGYITKAEMDEAKAVDYKPVTHTAKQTETYQAFVDYVIDEAEKVSGLQEEQLRISGYKIYTTLNTQAQSAMEKEFEDDNNFEKSVDEQQEQAAMIIVDHRNGEIQGLVGGRDYVNKGLNRVLEPRQPGSSFKPITVYGPAIETGDYSPSSILQDVKKCYGSYCPSDSNKVKYIGPITMRQSIKESRNASAVWLLNEIGVKTGLNFAKNLGFELDSSKDRNLAIGLGGLTYGVTPFQMATAYSAFANDGKSVDLHALVKITDKEDDPVYTYNAPESEQVMKSSTAETMTDMLQGVLEKGGTGVNARIDRPVAGKTGTTQNGIPGLSNGYNRDAWFAGYTPEWTAVVWMGYDRTDKDHMIKKSSEQSAAMFGKVMREAMKGVPKGSFKKPAAEQEAEKPPVGITNFSAVYNELKSAVQLAWSPVDGDGMTYRIYRKATGEAEFTKLLDSLTTTGVDDLNIAPGMSYEYYVTAYDPAKDLEGSPSATVKADIPEAEIEPPANPDEGTPGNNSGGGNNGQGNNGQGDNGQGNNGQGDNGQGNNGQGNNGQGNNGQGNNGQGNNGQGNNGGGTVPPGDSGNGTTPPDQGGGPGNTPANGGQTPGDGSGATTGQPGSDDAGTNSGSGNAGTGNGTAADPGTGNDGGANPGTGTEGKRTNASSDGSQPVIISPQSSGSSGNNATGNAPNSGTP
ncbi:PBP1A family penicillin-binding protein [Paenibacillus rhizovicinus]|uniref:PBP1A family penicillin-binding protein n=1 Tax=Paenibacillus rhizovicinus TaxID=2704463 RepID=A0A6C0P7F4_9BACL|nr:PBP1A family penicillin-binding protein [Paenibacillus rhizovicinus]QHW34484.1 PBP1A family penicillin-binding protein [Paenibacillus rhizovicinus]